MYCFLLSLKVNTVYTYKTYAQCIKRVRSAHALFFLTVP